jgi:hypothetical protein
MMMDEMVYMNELVKKEDPLTRLSQEAKERRLRNTPVLTVGKMPGIDIEELKRIMNKPIPIMVSEPFEIEHLEINSLNEELQAASRYIEENEVIHVKTKRDIPTVIEYRGRRYILDHSDTMKGGAKR